MQNFDIRKSGIIYVLIAFLIMLRIWEYLIGYIVSDKNGNLAVPWISFAFTVLYCLLIISILFLIIISLFSQPLYRKKLIQIYKGLALITFSTFVLFIGTNLTLWGGMELRDTIKRVFVEYVNPISQKYQTDLRTVYPEYNKDTIDALLKETWSRPYVYEPFTQLKERAYHGSYINVSEFGFRETKVSPKKWPPDKTAFNIFLFGGSTIFGYGVADDQTVASYLEEILRSKTSPLTFNIYNFGRGYYYTSQEAVLFLRLLSQGHVPDIALFVDGLNEFYQITDEPFFTKNLRDFVNKEYEKKKETLKDMLNKNKPLNNLPVYRLTRSLKERFSRQKEGGNNINPGTDTETYNNKAIIGKVISRYFNNKRIIESLGHSYNVRTVFVWQPVSTYKYDLKYHLFYTGDFWKHSYSQYGYPSMEQYVSLHPQGNNFIWAADIQENILEPLYVDKVHYSAKMSKLIAEYIGNEIIKRNLIGSSTGISSRRDAYTAE